MIICGYQVQKEQAIKFFKESYDVKHINYDNLQMTMRL